MVGNSRDEFLIGTFMTLAARLQFVVAEDGRRRVVFGFYIVGIMAARTDGYLRMSEMQLAPMEALPEAFHDVFLEFIFFNYFFVPVAPSARLNLLFTADC